jgi:hypothetical protein
MAILIHLLAIYQILHFILALQHHKTFSWIIITNDIFFIKKTI